MDRQFQPLADKSAMDFDEHDDGDGMVPMPVSSSYEVPFPTGLGGSGGGGGDPKIGDSEGQHFRSPPGESGCADRVRYRECLKNHAVGIGGHVVDVCGEFMVAGEEGSIDALRCAACGCHQNFHRKESDSPTGAEAVAVSLAAISAYDVVPHHQFSPYYRTPAGYLHHHQQHQMIAAAVAAAAAARAHGQRPLALPSTSHSGRDEVGDMSGMLSPMVMGAQWSE